MIKVIEFYLNHQFPRFLVFSGVAALTNMGVGYLLYEMVGLKRAWKYGLSVALAFLAGMAVSFILNRRFTFPASGRPVQRDVVTFAIVSLGGLSLTVALAYVFRVTLVPILLSTPFVAGHMPRALSCEMLSHYSAIFSVTLYSFAFHKLFSFGKGIRYYLGEQVAVEKGGSLCPAEKVARSG